MRSSRYLQNMLVGVTATLLVGAQLAPMRDLDARFASTRASETDSTKSAGDSSKAKAPGGVAAKTKAAIAALSALVRPLSHPKALEDAFQSYFSFKAAHRDEVQRPYLYFADYGLPSSTPRGYLFDMDRLKIVEGPFTVAHGRGSGARDGVPTRFSNAPGSEATSLGLYVASELYDFRGLAGGRKYESLGVRLDGVSRDFNDNARARHVVAHGAPYVSATIAGLSEGCPAMAPARAKRLLPLLANGGMVFLFAPDSAWLSGDQWTTR